MYSAAELFWMKIAVYIQCTEQTGLGTSGLIAHQTNLHFLQVLRWSVDHLAIALTP